MKNKKVRRMLAVMMAMSLSVSMCAGTALATEPAADTAVEKEAAEEEPTKKADADTSENVDDAEETSSEESAAVKAEEETSSEESAPVKEEEKSDAEETSETADNSIALQADDGQQGADQPGSGDTAPGGDGQTPPEGGEGGPGGPGGPGGQPSVEIDPSVVTDKYGMKGYHALLGSWGSGGDNINDVENGDNDYLYTAGLLVKTEEGKTDYTSASNYGNEDESKNIIDSYETINESEADGVVINDDRSGLNGIIIKDTDYTISNADITMMTDADGKDTCDFSGKGSAIAVYGDSNVKITGSRIHTAGVATMPIFADSGATVTVEKSKLYSDGGTLHGDYMNSPDQATMVAPPWILGIMGSSRTTNLMGNNSTMNVIDSETEAGAWAVLSTDSGQNMVLNVYNTSLKLDNPDESQNLIQEKTNSQGGKSQIYESLDNPYTTNYGSGYGTYAIGNAKETFAGATINVGTYATIFTGGSATYKSLVEGEEYTLTSANGQEEDTVTYTAKEDKNTVINSDTFGFMVHQGENTIAIEQGTEVNSGYATFLVKSGSAQEEVTATIDNAEIENGGVLVQVMDNDDATNGGMMDPDDPANLNGSGMNFKPYHEENAGFRVTEDSGNAGGPGMPGGPGGAPGEMPGGGDPGMGMPGGGSGETESKNDGTVQSFTFTNGDYSGNIYNASGSDNSENGPLKGTTVELKLGEGATLDGAVASTAAVHVTYDGSKQLKANGGDAFETVEEAADFVKEYQNTYFDMTHYFDIGHVANLIDYNGGNDIDVTLENGAVWNVDDTSVINSLTITGASKVVVPEGVTLTVDGMEYTDCTIYADNLVVKEDGNYYVGILGSWSSGGKTVSDNDYAYYATLFVKGDDYETYSNEEGIVAGSYDAGSAVNVEINDSATGHNGIIVVDRDYEIRNTKIIMDTTANGTDTCDFSGKGSAVAVYGNSYVTIKDSYIETKGVAVMPIFADGGATVLVDNSTLISHGGTLHGDYMNSPDQATMVAPPWILGIMGSSRTTNLMGNNSTMHVVDSTTEAGAWAVLSTDSGSNMYLNVYNTSLTLNNADESKNLIQEETNSQGGQSQIYDSVDNPYTTNYGSGYGTYAIGAAVETFAGATMNVGTYGTIFTGGSATYTDIVDGHSYVLESATGETDYTYVADESKNTVINSDTFGFMVHQGENDIVIENGTEVNSGYATFLVKSGSSGETVDATVDSSVLNNGGVLIQVMDNDDATNGGMMAADDPANLNGGGMNFKPYHEENAGFNTAAAENDGSVQNFTFTNGDYSGNIYNASGSDHSVNGALKATTLNVNLGKGATLDGAAASTAAIHVTYDGSEEVKENGGYAYDNAEAAAAILDEQNIYFDMTHYFDIGHVANLVNYNGGNDINMTLTDDAVWNVEATSVVKTLNVSGGAQVVIPEGVTLTVGDQSYTGGIITEAGFTAAQIDQPAGPGTTDPGTAGSDTDGGKGSTTTTSKNAKTGDTNQAALWLIVAAAGAGAVVITRKRRNARS